MTVIQFPGVPPPEPEPEPLTFEEWYQSEFADWFHHVENLPAERDEFIAALAPLRDRLNDWSIP